ncbi:serine hydrolase [Nonomuraea sp. NPDC049709]|uniref:serine hydrolase n=1 Tax=Nonomuraea sp. NPDC049709 TaxID=3154736 RepID=UPI00341518DE
MLATAALALAVTGTLSSGTVQAAVAPGTTGAADGGPGTDPGVLLRGLAACAAKAIVVGRNVAAYPSVLSRTLAAGQDLIALTTPQASSFRRPLTRTLDRYLDGVPGQVSVSVRDLSTGLSYSYNGGLRTAAASIVKVDVVMALLLKAQREGRDLTAWERRTTDRAIRVSDNAATTALWSAIGGGPGLSAANTRFGLRETAPDPGGAWGATTTSAADQVRLLTSLASPRSPLSAKNRRYLLGLMAGVAPEQAWGVSASGRGGADVALKNGWLPRERHGGRWTVNSIGRVRDRGHTYLIAVISHRHDTMGAGVHAVERVSRLVTDALATR